MVLDLSVCKTSTTLKDIKKIVEKRVYGKIFLEYFLKNSGKPKIQKLQSWNDSVRVKNSLSIIGEYKQDSEYNLELLLEEDRNAVILGLRIGNAWERRDLLEGYNLSVVDIESDELEELKLYSHRHGMRKDYEDCVTLNENGGQALKYMLKIQKKLFNICSHYSRKEKQLITDLIKKQP